MLDWWEIEQMARSALEPPSREERELMRFLMEEEDQRPSAPLRRRLAAGIVRLGLKLDPEALRALRAPRLEAANVRD